MNYLIGIDAGGTKSELIAYNLKSTKIYRDVGGFGQPCVNYDITLKNQCALIENCLSVLGEDNCLMIGIGMAGVEMGDAADRIKAYIENTYHIPAIILNDAVMTYKAYLGEDDGMIAICGTGSACFGQNGTETAVCGGWGHLLGDEGSGYHTVIQAFKQITKKLNENKPFDKLDKAILDGFGYKNLGDIKNFIYNNDKNVIADLFSVIVQQSELGDKSAIKLLADAGIYMADTTYTLYKRLGFDKHIQIGLKGGVFYHSVYMLNSYESKLRTLIPSFDLIKKDLPPTMAVCNMYKRDK